MNALQRFVNGSYFSYIPGKLLPMENENKKKSPYSGLWVSLLLLIGVPVSLFILFYVIIISNNLLGKELGLYTSLTFGFGIGLLFQFGCVVAGIFKEPVNAIIKRVKEFFEDLIISFGYAVKSYFENIKKDGFLFWIYLYIILFTLAIVAFSVYKYIQISGVII